MKRHAPILLLVAMCALARAANPPGTFHAGPVYTTAPGATASNDGTAPVFPQMQILMDPGDAAGKPNPADFRLTIDDVDCATALKLESFESTGHGVAVAFTIDVSGSMKGDPINAVRKGLVRFVDQAGPKDRIAIQTVADQGQWESEWNAPRDHLQAALRNLKTRGSLTRLWDGIFEALGSYSHLPPARRLVVVSDGHDEGSSRTEDQVVTAARAQHVAIDSIGLTRSNPIYLESLQSLSAQTGGHYRRATNEQQLEDLVASGIRFTRTLPVGDFEAKGVKADGMVHRFRVVWKHGGAEATSTFSAPLPKIASAANKVDKWKEWWIYGAAGATLLALGLFFIIRRKPKPIAPVPAVSGTTPPMPASPPFRSPTAVRPPPARPFVANPISPDQPAPAPAVLVSPAAPRPKKTEVAAHFPTPSPGHPCAWLHCEAGVAPGSDFPIEATEFWMGGLGNNHLPLDQDQTVSANHACIVFEQGSLGIVDNNSTNGTWVNEQRVTDRRQLLWPTDRVRVGRSTFVLRNTPSGRSPL